MLGPAECPEIVIAALRVRPLSADLVYRSDAFPPAAADWCSGPAESDRRTLLQIFRGRERIRWRIDSLSCVCFFGERCAKSMYRICEKGILHNPPRLLCDFYRAATKGWPQNESRAILFSAPGISVSDPETTPNLWKQKPVLPGRSFPITKVEFIRVITKQKSAISPPRKKVYISSFYD